MALPFVRRNCTCAHERPSDRKPRMTSDCCPDRHLAHWAGRSNAFHAVSARPGDRLIRPVRFGVSQPLVEPAPPSPSLLDKVELRPGIIMPVFENDGLEVLGFMLDVEQDIIRGIGVCLNEEERRRAEGFRLERDRRRFVATRGQLRRVLASKLGISPSDVELEYGRLANPTSRTACLPAICASASHDPEMWRSSPSRPGKRSGWTSRQFSLCPKRTRSQRSAFPPPSTGPTPPLVRKTGWKASSGAGPGWRLSLRPWGAA